ncbi:MAG: hypothetical protein ACRET7_15310 [Burkholderiales bacterium]
MENVRNVEVNTAAAQECCAPAAKSGWLNPRNLLIGVALAGGAGALVLGWDWLVAAGLASIIVAVAPCLVMCALGLCMSRQKKNDPSAAGTPPAMPGPDARQAVKAELPSEPNPPLPGSRT